MPFPQSATISQTHLQLCTAFVFRSVARQDISTRVIMFLILMNSLQSSLLCVVGTWFQGGVYVQWVPLVYLILVRVQLWSVLCCRFSCCLCFSSFHVLLLSFTLEYLLLISEEIALILLSRSCFMVAFSGSSAWALKYPANELSCKQLKLFR